MANPLRHAITHTNPVQEKHFFDAKRYKPGDRGRADYFRLYPKCQATTRGGPRSGPSGGLSSGTPRTGIDSSPSYIRELSVPSRVWELYGPSPRSAGIGDQHFYLSTHYTPLHVSRRTMTAPKQRPPNSLPLTPPTRWRVSPPASVSSKLLLVLTLRDPVKRIFSEFYHNHYAGPAR